MAEGSFVWIEVSKTSADLGKSRPGHAFKRLARRGLSPLLTSSCTATTTCIPRPRNRSCWFCSIQPLKSLDKALNWLLQSFFQEIMRHQLYLATANPPSHQPLPTPWRPVLYLVTAFSLHSKREPRFVSFSLGKTSSKAR